MAGNIRGSSPMGKNASQLDGTVVKQIVRCMLTYQKSHAFTALAR